MGDLETALGLCTNLTHFRLSYCTHISSILLRSLADFSPNLKVLRLDGCPIGDGVYLSRLIQGCPYLEVLDLSGTNVSLCGSLDLILSGLQHLRELILDGAGKNNDDADENSNNQIIITGNFEKFCAIYMCVCL